MNESINNLKESLADFLKCQFESPDAVLSEDRSGKSPVWSLAVCGLWRRCGCNGRNLPVIDRGCIFYPFDTGVGLFGLRNGYEKECSEE